MSYLVRDPIEVEDVPSDELICASMVLAGCSARRQREMSSLM